MAKDIYTTYPSMPSPKHFRFARVFACSRFPLDASAHIRLLDSCQLPTVGRTRDMAKMSEEKWAKKQAKIYLPHSVRHENIYKMQRAQKGSCRLPIGFSIELHRIRVMLAVALSNPLPLPLPFLTVRVFFLLSVMNDNLSLPLVRLI